MARIIEKIFEGQLVDDGLDITLLQLCELCRTEPQDIIEMIEEGILEPIGKSKRYWRFSHITVERIRKVNRLRNDLEINLAGAALALHLLDRIELLESRLQRLGALSD